MNDSGKSDHAPFAGSEVNVPSRSYAGSEEDPYFVLDQLMVVVEALCPVWPPRPTFADAGEMRL